VGYGRHDDPDSIPGGALAGTLGGWIGIALYRLVYLLFAEPTLTPFIALLVIGAALGGRRRRQR